MGAWRISRKNVLTRRVAAIEALGSISALCVDKTGTLTLNKMSVLETAPEVLAAAALACPEHPFDPMDKAILAARAERRGESEPRRERRAFYPLSSGLMAMSCVWKTAGETGLTVAAKGAPEAILTLCRCDTGKTEEVLREVHRSASRGLRVLGVARATHPEGHLPKEQREFAFEYSGLLTLEDPIRPEVPAAIAECRAAGIRVLVLTGDYPETARSVARRLELPDSIVTGEQLARTDDAALLRLVRDTAIYARVTPDQKLRIVRALKEAGERVAMTGDGVNDAPSLRWADIGVAMGGRGTDVAREAASIVLLDDSFASMVAAIRLGRRIYDNLRKAVFFILAIHVPIAGLAILPVLLKLPLLLLPAHIVFLELIIDPACSLVYEAEEEEADVMRRKPRSAGTPLVGRRDLLLTGGQGAIILILVLALYVGLLKTGHSDGEARASAFQALILSNLGLILVNRVRTGGLLGALRKANRAFTAVVAGAVVMLALIMNAAAIRTLFSFSPLVLHDTVLSIATGLLSLLLINWLRRTLV
jgi:Ca2+-transporting ATPase